MQNEEEVKNGGSPVGAVVFGRFAISPERVWSCGYWFLISTYSFGAFLLFFVSKPDLRVDPAMRTYKAFHPCIIIDYSPGNLWAQLTFLLNAYSLLLSGTISLFRVAQLRNAFLLVVSALAYGMLWAGMSLLVLTVTFNPSFVSVLLHSVPYMVYGGGYGMFMLSELVVSDFASQSTTCKHIIWYAYNGWMVGTCFYGVLFMSKVLATTNDIDVTLPATDPRNILEPMEFELQLLPTIMAFIVFPLHILRPFVCPLTARPLAANLSVLAIHHDAPRESGEGSSEWRLDLRASKVHLWGVFIALVGMCLAYYFNDVFNPNIAGEFPRSFREEFKTLPGAAIIAVSWTLAVPLLALHAFILSTYVRSFVRSCSFKVAFLAVAIIFSISAILAHGGTVPGAPNWYRGVDLFRVMLGCWLVAQCVLAMLFEESESKLRVVGKLVAGALAAIFLVLSIMMETRWSLLAFMAAWMLFAAVDPLCASLTIDNIAITTCKNSPETLCNNLFHCYWLDEGKYEKAAYAAAHEEPPQIIGRGEADIVGPAEDAPNKVEI